MRGYGTVLTENVVENWCEYGYSNEHLGEVCKRSVGLDGGCTVSQPEGCIGCAREAAFSAGASRVRM